MRRTSLAIIALVFVVVNGLSQHQEGLVEYAITVKPGDTTALQKQRAALLFDSKMALQFNDSLARMDFKMGKGMLTSVIVNNYLKQGITLNSTSAGKFAFYLTKDYFDQKPTEDSVQVELVNEEKKILGYTCKRANLIANGVTTTYWYTNELNFDIKQQAIVNKHIPGFPLKYNTVKDGLYMEFEVTNIEFTIKDPETTFSLLIPQGFKVVK